MPLAQPLKFKMKAKLKFRDTTKWPSPILNKQGIICEWDFAYKIGDENFYTSTDIKLNDSDSYSEHDLEVVNE